MQLCAHQFHSMRPTLMKAHQIEIARRNKLTAANGDRPDILNINLLGAVECSVNASKKFLPQTQ